MSDSNLHISIPRPYYQDNSVTIYNADCRDVLPFIDPVDIVLTDPPYGMNFQSNYRKKKHKKIKNDNAMPLDLIYLALIKATRAAFFFCRWNNIPQMPSPPTTPLKSVLVWVKNNWGMGDLKHEYGRQWEAICFYALPRHKFIKRPSDVFHCPRTQNSLHPTQKPTQLLIDILKDNEGDVVLDPFMGSGSTILAAMALGRKAIGIEIDEQYCEIAVNRIVTARNSLSVESLL